jgi:predicted SAM-dependent methyltransferase
MVAHIKRNALLLRLYKQIPDFVKKIIFFGKACYCPVCNSHVRAFYPAGTIKRDNAMCPVCGLVERHRFIWCFLKRKTDLFSTPEQKFLHIAPEQFLVKKIRRIKTITYYSIDIEPGKALEQMDITDLQYPDSFFDVIFCSNVLEHVMDDTKAMQEMYRVLKLSGWVMVMVPLKGKTTYEDSSIDTPAGRRKQFGLEDHVRVYGLDLIQRLENAGFTVTLIKPADIINQNEVDTLHLIDSERIFFCEKIAKRV